MPCNSDHMNPTHLEKNLSEAMTLLDELNGLSFNKNYFRGYHPKVYCKSVYKEHLDKATAELCSRLSKTDVTKYSLEMQVWWRDHQEADKARKVVESVQRKQNKEKEEVLAKLTPEERKLLGL
jgi:hypothetical protein